MEIPLPRRGGLMVALLVLLVLGAAFAFYFFHYLHQRSEYLRSRNLRELATLARQIEDVVATWDGVAWSYARDLTSRDNPGSQGNEDPRTEDFSHDRAATEGGGTAAGETVSTLDHLDLAPADQRFGEDDWYRIRSGELAGGLLYWPEAPETVADAPKKRSEDSDPDTAIPPDPGREAIVSKGIHAHSQGRAYWLSFEFEGGKPLAIYLRLSRVLGNLSLPEDFFDHLVLLEGERIVFRRTGPDLKLTRLELDDGKDGKPKPLPARSHHDLIKIAGRTFEVFTQPVTVRSAHLPPGSPEATVWTLGGLVSAERLRTEGGALSPLAILVMLCVFLALILLVPVIKGWSLVPHERLRRRDLMALAVSSVCAVGLLTLLMADLWAYQSLRQTVDNSLCRLSSAIERHLVEELKALQAQLLRLTSGDSQSDPPLGPQSPERENLLEHWSADWEYPWFHSAFWVDPTGWPCSQWTVERQGSPRVSVAQRAYFREAAAGRLWFLEGSPRGFILEPIPSLTTGTQAAVLAMPDPERPGAVYAIATELISITRPVLPVDIGFAILDGAGRTVFHSDPGRNGQEDFVAASDENPRLQAALRAPGAVSRFDAFYQGRPHWMLVRKVRNLPLWLVVFHSKSSLNQLHLDQMRWVLTTILLLLLALAVLAFLLSALSLLLGGRIRWPERSDLKLAGVLALLAGTLLWALVQSELAPKLILAMTLPPVALLFFLVRVVWQHSRRQRWLTLLPPICWFFALVASLGVFFGPGTGEVRAGITPPVLLFAAAAVLWLSRSPFEVWGAPWRWLAVGSGVVTSILLFFLVVAALPTSLLFQVAWQFEWWSLMSRGQRHLAEQLESRDERVRSRFHPEHMALPKPQLNGLLHRRLSSNGGICWDRYETSFFDTRSLATCFADERNVSAEPVPVDRGVSTRELSTGDAAVSQAESFGPWLWMNLQRLQERQLQQHLTANDATERLVGSHQWNWRGGFTQSRALLLVASRPDQTRDYRLWTSGTPPHERPPPMLVLVVVGGGLLLGVFTVTVHRFLTWTPETGTPAENLSDLGDHLLWTTGTDQARAVFPEGPDTAWLDLANPGDRERIRRGDRKFLTSSTGTTASRVVFANLDLLGTDAESWRELLGFAEPLVREHGCSLVFLSEVHLAPGNLIGILATPAPKATPETEEEEANGSVAETPAGGAQQARVVALLSSLTVYPFERMGSQVEMMERPASGRGSEGQGLAWLVEEAGCHPRLQRAAAWLARHPALAELKERQLKEAFAEAVELYYRWLWERSSKGEKRLLFQLAQESLANPRARDATRRLLRRGLVTRTSYRGLTPLNRTFRRWVIETGIQEGVRELERGSGGWHTVRVPVYLVLGAMLLFLLSTRLVLSSGTLGQLQQTFVQMVTVLTALAGGLAGLTQLLVRFSGGR